MSTFSNCLAFNWRFPARFLKINGATRLVHSFYQRTYAAEVFPSPVKTQSPSRWFVSGRLFSSFCHLQAPLHSCFPLLDYNRCILLLRCRRQLHLIWQMAARRSSYDNGDTGGEIDMDKKRKHTNFDSGSNFVTLADISTWTEDFAANKSKFQYISKSDALPNNIIASKVSLWRGDITSLEIDAIVNAANSSLMGGGGVDGAIHNAAGPKLKRECSSLGGCSVGVAKITKGYNLPSRHVIHTVGPRVGRSSDLSGRCRNDLQNCYLNSLKVMLANNLRSVAFPCISTGIFGYPNEPAAEAALAAVRSWLERNPLDSVDRIIFCVFLENDIDIYRKLIFRYFPIDQSQLQTPSL